MKETPYKSYKDNPMYIFLLLLAIAGALGFQGWRTLFNNFAVEEVGVNSIQIGIIQSVREVPGLLTFFVVYLLVIIAEHRFASLSIIFMGLGVLFTGIFPSIGGLMVTTVIMSAGFHFYETCNQSLTLQYFATDRVSQVLAKLRSMTALTNVLIGVSVWVMAKYFSFKIIFLVIGVAVLVISIYTLTKNPVDKNLPPQQKKPILKKKYWLFYMLNFLSGARRQIFVVFAVFLLVEKYQFSVTHITTLFVINNIITYFISPYVGKAINKYGERAMLSVEYSALLLIFLSYAFIENRDVASVLYVVNNIFFPFSIAIKTFFRKQALPEDIAPSMGVGFTINHITAIVLPVIGGYLWTINWKIPFLMGAFIAIISLVFTQYIKSELAKIES